MTGRRRRRRLVAAAATAGLVLFAALLWIASGRGIPGTSTAAKISPARPPVNGFRPVTGPERAAMPRSIAMGAVGSGTKRVYVLRRAGARQTEPLVIFFHGYGTATVAGQEPWLAHIAMRATVLWPVYNAPPFDGKRGGAKMFPAAAAGLRVALSRVREKKAGNTRKLVVAGYSLGGALAADYAAAAVRFGLPRPRALYAVFPGRGLCDGAVRLPPQPGRIAANTRVLAIASSHDLLARTCGARRIVAGATAVPRSRKQLRIIRDYTLGDHFAPTRAGTRERATFWRPLDRLTVEISTSKRSARRRAARGKDRRKE